MKLQLQSALDNCGFAEALQNSEVVHTKDALVPRCFVPTCHARSPKAKHTVTYKVCMASVHKAEMAVLLGNVGFEVEEVQISTQSYVYLPTGSSLQILCPVAYCGPFCHCILHVGI